MSGLLAFKQVLVVRTDLGMSSGKIAAQAAHASLESYKKAASKKKLWVRIWEASGCKKVVLAVDSLEKIKSLQEKAGSLRLPNALITDAGFTEIKSGTITALGIGPAPDAEVDKVTGHLEAL